MVLNAKAWPSDPLTNTVKYLAFKVRGDRKITTGITGLWQPSVHSDVAF